MKMAAQRTHKHFGLAMTAWAARWPLSGDAVFRPRWPFSFRTWGSRVGQFHLLSRNLSGRR